MTKNKETHQSESGEVLKQMEEAITQMFADFGVPVKIIESIDGLRNYHFHIQPIKSARMKSMSAFKDDLRYALENHKVEIEAPIPDKKLVGITVPKKDSFPALSWSEVNAKNEHPSAPLLVPLGIDEFGFQYDIDIARTPHLLIAGTTGSGKSTIIHSILNSLVERNTPESIRFLLIDQKRTDLTLYGGLPHLLAPPIVESKKAIMALKWVTKEMDRRYSILESEKSQNISLYHQNISEPAFKEWQKTGAHESDRYALPEPLPFIVVVIDEIADLMQGYPKEVEALVVRLAQMSRTVGIHLIISTQRPSVNVVTGSMKANIPTRIALTVASQIDSRTIIDQTGAEKLTGDGDMLYQSSDSPKPVRLKGYFISESEIKERVEHCIQKYTYGLETVNLNESSRSTFSDSYNSDDDEDDDLYEDAKTATLEAGKVSTSFIQRKLRIGYSRAARLIDLLEERGIIGPQDGAKPRQIIGDASSIV